MTRRTLVDWHDDRFQAGTLPVVKKEHTKELDLLGVFLFNAPSLDQRALLLPMASILGDGPFQALSPVW